MQEFEIPPFYVGQEVVAIKTHPDKIYVKWNDYKVLEVGKTPCCQAWYIYTGFPTPSGRKKGTHCVPCNKPNAHPTKVIFPAHHFKAKIELTEFISMKQLAETQLETIGAN